MSTSVVLRRWPFPRNAALRLPLAAEFLVETEGRNGPRLTRQRALDRLPETVAGWFTTLDSSEVAFAILSNDEGLLKIGDRTLPVNNTTAIHHQTGLTKFQVTVAREGMPEFLFKYRIDDEGFWRNTIGVLLRFVDNNEAVDADPLATLAGYVRARDGFRKWLAALQRGSGAYLPP